MADPFLAEIRVFPFNFPPKGWAFCAGQIMPLSQNTALFALLGTTYGGDGKSTFALPNLFDRAAMHPGQARSGTLYDLGQEDGTAFVTLLQSEMPMHTHGLQVSVFDAGSLQPTNSMFAKGKGVGYYDANTQPTTTMNPGMLTTAGGSQPHNNMQPYLAMYFNIALQGIFPPRG